MGIRKNYRKLTDVERDRFVQALYHVKSTGLVDQFANMHATHFFMNIHRSSHFLPWHREFLLRFERALQAHHPDVTIPYWDSSVDTSPSDPLWNNSFLGQFNAAWGLGRALGSATLPTPGQVETNQGRGTYDAFWPELEPNIHNPPHNWVGGVMADIASPGDPVFYLHHCWIDLLWARWQLAHPGAPFVPSRPGAGLNDPLMEWPDRTPADVLDHHALDYIYDIETGGPIFFYNATTGLGATSRLDAAGNYTFVGSIPGFSTGWTHIVGTSNGGVLFYNASTGEGATARLDAAGNYTFVGSLSGFSPWTHVAGL